MPTWSNQAKNSASWSNQQKPLGFDSFLLKEDGFYLLLEQGGKIVLEQSGVSQTTWSNLAKS